MTWLAAAGYSSDSATVCGGALSNLWNGENGAVQQPWAAHDGVAARAVVMAPDRMLPSVARASSVVVTRSRFVRIVFLQAERADAGYSLISEISASSRLFPTHGELNLEPGKSHKQEERLSGAPAISVTRGRPGFRRKPHPRHAVARRRPRGRGAGRPGCRRHGGTAARTACS